MNDQEITSESHATDAPQQPQVPASTTEQADSVHVDSLKLASDDQAPTTQSQNDPQPQTLQKPNPAAATATAPVTKKRRSKWLMPVIIIGALLVIGGGAYGYMGVYMQTPQNVWKSALRNTGDSLTAYVNTTQKSYSGGKINGTFTMTSPTTADGSVTGAFDAKNAVLSMNAGALGVRATAELRSIITDPATSPDVYIKLGGLKTISGLMGSSSPYTSLLNQLDDTWYFVDHTLTAQAATKVGTAPESAEQLQKDIQTIATKVNVVFQDYIFTTDQNKAVIVVKESLGKEDFKGRKSQKYIAQVRKHQLKDMVVVLKDTLKETRAKEWVVGTSGKTFEEQANFEQLIKEIDALSEDKLTAEVWVDSGLKYIRNVRITAPNQKDNATSTVDFMMDYIGGESVPLTVTSTVKDTKNNGSVQLGVTLHKNSSNAEFNLVVAGSSNGQRIDATLKVAVEPTNDPVAVAKPDGAKNIMGLLGGVLGANTDKNTADDAHANDLLQSFNLY